MRRLRSPLRTLFARRRSATRAAAPRLLVLDDVFPNLLTGFRVAEFNAYMAAFPGTRVLTTQHWFPTAGGAVGFAASHAEYAEQYPQFADQVELHEDDELPDADLAYLVFINNGAKYLAQLEKAGLPFVITIYPGGGMQLNDAATDDKLRRVLGSELCRRVVTTQKVTYDYIVDRGFIPVEKVVHVFGVVAMDSGPAPGEDDRVRFGFSKDTLDIVFAAHKYAPHGMDKGYDIFLDAARIVAAERSDVRFHVVGPWSVEDYPTDGLADILTFHGLLRSDELQALYLRSDVVVSPNRPFTMTPGGYDGFPLGSCVEAGLVGTAVVATNELGESAFVDGTDLVVVRPEAADVAGRLSELAADPAALRRLGENARTAFSSVYTASSQLEPRLELVRSELIAAHATAASPS